MFKKIKTFVAKRWKLLSILAVIIGAIIFLVNRNGNQEVKTATVQRGNISEEIILSGEIVATNYARLSFETPGKIVYVGVSEGDKVLKGRLLSRLDTTVLNSSYQIALSNLRAAEAALANVHDQVKGHDKDENFTQIEQRTVAETNKDKAYEAVVAAKRNLDGGSLMAPFPGYITYVAHPFSGVYTTPAAHEIEIIDPTTIYFDVLADQTEVIRLVSGQKVKILLDSFEEKEFDGIVKTISFTPKVGEAGAVYSVKVNFVGVDFINSQFKIAMSGEAKFVVSEKDNVLYVPSEFVKQDSGGKYLRTGEKEKLYIETGIESEENTEVFGDINEGQAVLD